jgi:hypothetical protein
LPSLLSVNVPELLLVELELGGELLLLAATSTPELLLGATLLLETAELELATTKLLLGSVALLELAKAELLEAMLEDDVLPSTSGGGGSSMSEAQLVIMLMHPSKKMNRIGFSEIRLNCQPFSL